jgi:CheY-like chemotaxis protein
MNLITNSADSLGKSGGSISLSTGIIQCDQDCLDQMAYKSDLPEGRYVYLDVIDDGCGMSAEVRTKLFDPFFTTKSTGRGLGMSAVLGIVRAHGGVIDIDSAPGEGTRTRVLLPALSSVERLAPAEPVVDIVHVDSSSILVVDDEPVVRLLTQKVLEHAGYNVLSASDGKEGLGIYRRHHEKIAAVVLDMTMPGMGGLEVLKHMKKINQNVRVVLCSGFSKNEAVRTVSGEAVAAFLHKPFEPKDLLKILRETVGGRKEVSSD